MKYINNPIVKKLSKVNSSKNHTYAWWDHIFKSLNISEKKEENMGVVIQIKPKMI